MKTVAAKPRQRPAAKIAPVRANPAPQSGEVIAWLKRNASNTVRDGMSRFNIPADKAFGISVGTLRKEAKRIGTDHELAGALWDSGWYEARMLATMIDDPAQVTSAQMDRWIGDFDNWAICDTACFTLFDRTSLAWRKVAALSNRDEEFAKRTAFALLWALSVHDKHTEDAAFVQGLQLIEREAGDERHFVKKAVNMALRAIGKRNAALNAAAVAAARRLAASERKAARWIGRDALRELTSVPVRRRLAAR